MKKNRKLTALLVAACMTIPMAATTFTVPMVASAENETVITLSAENSELEAYQIFKGTYNDSTKKLGVSGWGDVFSPNNTVRSDWVLSYLQALSNDNTLKENNTSIFATAWTGTDINSAVNQDPNKLAQDIADILAKKSEFAVPFARFTANYIYGHNEMKELRSGNKETNSDTGLYEITDLTDGYYIFADKNEPTSKEWTLGMLEVIDDQMGGVSVGEKRSQSSVEKFVKESGTDDNTYAEQVDCEIGETVHFKIECTLPTAEELNYFTAYYLEINDTLGSAFDTPKNVTLKNGTDVSTATSIASNIENYPNTNNYSYSYTGKTITVKMEDVKQYAGNKIYLEYDAVLNSNAQTGNDAFGENKTQNKNSVQIKYSNNPNYVWLPQDSNTTETLTEYVSTSVADSVKVYTYNLKIDKFEKDNDINKLSGAKFKLKKNNQYAILTDNSDGTYTFSGWNNNGTEVITTANGATIVGIDADTYALTELEAPEGYNKLTSDVDVVIDAAFSNSVLTKLSLNSQDTNGDLNTGTVTLGVPNAAGAQLPSTGGIGTKIFYVLGGTLVIGSGAALVIKKRMGKDEE